MIPFHVILSEWLLKSIENQHYGQEFNLSHCLMSICWGTQRESIFTLNDTVVYNKYKWKITDNCLGVYPTKNNGQVEMQFKTFKSLTKQRIFLWSDI